VLTGVGPALSSVPISVLLVGDQVVSGIVKTLHRLIGEDIELKFIPGKGLGRIRLDPMQIEQILMNLAANARDAMPEGGRCTIETSDILLDEEYAANKKAIIPPGRYAVLSMTDTGAGISPDHLPHIFEPFYTTKPLGKGTGAWPGDGVWNREAESRIRLGLQRT
jgi:two-component system, cell cycle sensor histidine kinase and response regulator CckA